VHNITYKFYQRNLTVLNEQEYQQYLQQVLDIYRPAINSPSHQVIFDREHNIVFATDLSAQSVGFPNGNALCGVSFKRASFDRYYEDEELQKLFKDLSIESTRQSILDYSSNLIYLQQLVITHGKPVKFIDMLPYNNQLVAYLTTYCPLFHPSGEVIAIHSISIKTYILRFQGHLQDPNTTNSQSKPNHKATCQFTTRELEILFLLSNGASQEQIAQILGIARGTVSAIITNQLCPKFSIPGANTKLLVREAIDGGYYRQMPVSLWRPCLIVLNEELLDNINFSQNSATDTQKNT